jgi:hypothetical protein
MLSRKYVLFMSQPLSLPKLQLRAGLLRRRRCMHRRRRRRRLSVGGYCVVLAGQVYHHHHRHDPHNNPSIHPYYLLLLRLLHSPHMHTKTYPASAKAQTAPLSHQILSRPLGRR